MHFIHRSPFFPFLCLDNRDVEVPSRANRIVIASVNPTSTQSPLPRMTRMGFEPHPSPAISLSGTSHSRSPFSLPNTQPQGHAKCNPTIPLPGSKRDSPTNIVIVIVAANAIVPATQVHYLCLHLDAHERDVPTNFFVREHGDGSFERGWRKRSGSSADVVCLGSRVGWDDENGVPVLPRKTCAASLASPSPVRYWLWYHSPHPALALAIHLPMMSPWHCPHPHLSGHRLQ